MASQKKILFLDRDGVINRKPPEHEYVLNVGQFVLNEGIGRLLSEYMSDGYEIIVITNQRGIARGLLDDKTLEEIHARMKAELQSLGIHILDIFYCPHETGTCECRKPKPGLLKQAQARYAFSKAESVLISDSLTDVEMGVQFGVGKNILVRNDSLEILKVIGGEQINNKTISACVVIFNEEKVLERCLKSIVRLVDEIIVVHDGECKDASVEIAKHYTDQVFVRDHVGSMEGHLAFALRQSKGKWILRIDADEYFDDGDRDKIRALTSQEGISAFSFVWEMWDGTKAIHYAALNKICLFRRETYKFFGVPNEPGRIIGKVSQVGMYLRHRPAYNKMSFKIFFDRAKRFAPLNSTYYFRELVTPDCFNAEPEEWFAEADKIRKHALFYLVFIPLKISVYQLWRGAWKKVVYLKLLAQQVIYFSVLHYNIWKTGRKLRLP